MKTSPIINMSLDLAIKKVVGEYNNETADLIWKIADTERELMAGCRSQKELENRVSDLIK